LQSWVAAREVTAPECKIYLVIPPSRNGCNKSSSEPVSDPEMNPWSYRGPVVGVLIQRVFVSSP
jgi:hypothetical protein